MIINRLWLRWTIVLLLAGVSIYAVKFGLQLRRDQWDRTMSIRYEGDVGHGWDWGQIGKRVGVLNVYDLNEQGRVSGTNDLDYTPFRLAAVTAWAHWAEKYFPNARSWDNDYELTKFMLMLNATAEFAAAILVFLLIRHWVIRMDDTNRSPLDPKRAFRGVLPGLIGAAFFWFNPAVIWNDCWPQWDCWNMPFYLGAVLLACLDWWFVAGCCIVVGAFFKGQILLVAPVLLIWPLVQLRFGDILRFFAGFVMTGAAIASLWMHASVAAFIWFILAMIALALAAPIGLRWRLDWKILTALAVAALLLIWPWKSTADLSTRSASLIVLGIVALARVVSPRLAPHLYALAVGALILLMMPLFNASSSWYSTGFEFGTVKNMHMGRPGTNSFPTVLATSFGWDRNDPQVMVNIPWIEYRVHFRNLMLSMYATCLAISGIGAAIQARRNDTRFLVAIVAPWLCWFVLLPQMNNRYMIWAAGFSALFVAVGLGMTLLGAIVAVVGWLGIARTMCESGGDPDLARLINPLTPHLAWLLMLAAAIYLYVAITPRRRMASLASKSLPESQPETSFEPKAAALV